MFGNNSDLGLGISSRIIHPLVRVPANHPGQLKTAPTGSISNLEGLHELVKFIPEDTQDGSIYMACLAVHHGEYEVAQITLSTSSCWPSLGMISSTNAFEPLATPPAPKLLQVTGSKMSAARRRNAVAVPARSVDVDEELLETERFPEFRNDLSSRPHRGRFIHSINLSQSNFLQDPRRLLTLWFDFGQYPKVFDALVEGMRMFKIITWLQVIRQLKIKIDNPRIQMLKN
ncbi:FKBP-rapamycin associated protein [Culex quinquefasciatus]|uniref:FKBP-rapamycin associated protein n=1 Tax=Culex quinquefasciatus TaxID=7176 RepID=B0XJS6_CULQU|nr:FKBP-rapamycin associated protein [Culex quinquefasciatus]|eukprot:XP_001869898.1 FKBP-rapamycin associated protein [Culex quinquefasciatus]